MDDERDEVRADLAMLVQEQDENRKTEAQLAAAAGLPKPPKLPKGTAPKKVIYEEPVETELVELRKPQEPKVRVRGDRERQVTVPQTSDAGVSRDASREEQVQDVLERTFRGSRNTFNQKQLFDEAKKRWEDEGRSAELPIKRAEANAFLRLQESSQLQAPLPPFGGKIQPGLFPAERVDIDIVDYSRKLEEKKERERGGFRPGETGPRYVAMLQDRNTRKLYSEAMKTKTGPEVLSTYRKLFNQVEDCLLYTSPSPRDATLSRMPSSA